MKQATRRESAFIRDYIKLLTAATSVPKAVDEYFFGTDDGRHEDDEEMRPYFYSFIIFSVALTVFMHVVIK